VLPSPSWRGATSTTPDGAGRGGGPLAPLRRSPWWPGSQPAPGAVNEADPRAAGTGLGMVLERSSQRRQADQHCGGALAATADGYLGTGLQPWARQAGVELVSVGKHMRPVPIGTASGRRGRGIAGFVVGEDYLALTVLLAVRIRLARDLPEVDPAAVRTVVGTGGKGGAFAVALAWTAAGPPPYVLA